MAHSWPLAGYPDSTHSAKLSLPHAGTEDLVPDREILAPDEQERLLVVGPIAVDQHVDHPLIIGSRDDRERGGVLLHRRRQLLTEATGVRPPVLGDVEGVDRNQQQWIAIAQRVGRRVDATRRSPVSRLDADLA